LVPEFSFFWTTELSSSASVRADLAVPVPKNANVFDGKLRHLTGKDPIPVVLVESPNQGAYLYAAGAALALLLPLSGLLVTVGRAQNKAAIVGSGPVSPALISVAPGSIITVYAAGLSPSGLPAIAQSVPLPTSLGGIGASIQPRGLSVPLISVLAIPPCALQACSTLTAIRLQIPFEVPPNIPGAGFLPGPVWLVVTDKAGNSAAVDLAQSSDQIQVLAVTHADGSPVAPQGGKPAQPGEELVAYAVGLGLTNPQVGTGQTTPSPAPRTTTTFAINYAFSPNAAPSRGLISPSSPTPLFVGLSPGSVGLYQINFVVPPPPSGALSCAGNVNSNLTVSIVGGTFDGAPICVAVP